MSKIAVTLTWGEMQQGAFAGCQRRLRAIKDGRQHHYGEPKKKLWDLWGTDVGAALCEQATAKGLGAYWGDTPAPDIDGDVGAYFVRGTELARGGLILHPDDLDGRIYICTIGTGPDFRLVGWLYAEEGKIGDFWRTDLERPCFIAPQRLLHGMEELP